MFGHPRGLMTLFFTELWERFSYYGMRGLLVLFLADAMRGGFGMDAQTAGAIYGLYTGMVYLLALPGGWIADRILGQRQAVFIGGCVIAAGHFSMAIPATETFYLGLVLIVIGTGLLKPNVSAIVGDLYPEGGGRRDAGFSIFYMGINIGAFVGPLICGYLGENIDWHLGFSAAGVGMVFGLLQYKLGFKYLGDAGLPKNIDSEARAQATSTMYKALVGLVGIIAVIALLQFSAIIHLTLPGVAQAMGVVIFLIAVGYFIYVLIVGNLNTAEKKRLAVIFFLFISSAVFWAGFEQAGSSLNLFAERLTDRDIFGWLMPASWLQSVNAFFIIALAPVFSWLWIWLGHKQPSIPIKFALGLILLGAGFAVLAWGSIYAYTAAVSPMWLIITYLLHTTGELCLSPVGLSSITKLSPPKFVGQMMGIWFTGTSLGNLLAGLAAGKFEVMPLPELFGTVALITAGFGVIAVLISRPIKKMIGGIE